MLHAKFQNHRPSGSEEEDFNFFFAIYSHGRGGSRISREGVQIYLGGFAFILLPIFSQNSP